MAIHLKSTGVDFTDLGNLGGMASELLDDYEFGTYTPAFAGFTASSASGGYCAIGRFVQAKIFLVSPGSGGSTTLSSTLPYTVGNVSYNYGTCSMMMDSLTANHNGGTGFQCSINDASGIPIKSMHQTGSHAGMAESETTSSTDFRIDAHYFT
jgi:hypothetical protein